MPNDTIPPSSSTADNLATQRWTRGGGTYTENRRGSARGRKSHFGPRGRGEDVYNSGTPRGGINASSSSKTYIPPTIRDKPVDVTPAGVVVGTSSTVTPQQERESKRGRGGRGRGFGRGGRLRGNAFPRNTSKSQTSQVNENTSVLATKLPKRSAASTPKPNQDIADRIKTLTKSIMDSASKLARRRGPEKHLEAARNGGHTKKRYNSVPPMDREELPEYIDRLEKQFLNLDSAKERASMQVSEEMIKENEQSELHEASSVMSTTLHPSQATSSYAEPVKNKPLTTFSQNSSSPFQVRGIPTETPLNGLSQRSFPSQPDPQYTTTFTDRQEFRLQAARKLIHSDNVRRSLEGFAKLIVIHGERAAEDFNKGRPINPVDIKNLQEYQSVFSKAEQMGDKWTQERLGNFSSQHQSLFTELSRIAPQQNVVVLGKSNLESLRSGIFSQHEPPTRSVSPYQLTENQQDRLTEAETLMKNPSKALLGRSKEFRVYGEHAAAAFKVGKPVADFIMDKLNAGSQLYTDALKDNDIETAGRLRSFKNQNERLFEVLARRGMKINF